MMDKESSKGTPMPSLIASLEEEGGQLRCDGGSTKHLWEESGGLWSCHMLGLPGFRDFFCHYTPSFTKYAAPSLFLGP